ncbi:hypothetical protein UlMin_036164 [Ulmus minor]
MEKANGEKALHVVLFPWLAMGHLIPFFHLSKRLAQKGHKVSFVSTPKNLTRLPKIPLHLSSLLNLVPLPFPHLPNLPPNAESSADVPFRTQSLLKKAFDLLEEPLFEFLESSTPDWIIYDYPSHWLHPRAATLGISRAFFSLFTAASLCFIGPPELLIGGEDKRSTAEDFAVVPEWVPFESNLAYRLHEVAQYVDRTSDADVAVTSDTVRFGVAAAESDFVAIRTRPEFEPEWLDLLARLVKKPVVPVGFLPPVIEEGDEEERWIGIKEWLDKWEANSVVYVALGTEATLTREQLSELALGLELTELPFFWVLRNPPGSTQAVLESLPDGFLERVKDRGIVHVDWVPQVRILSHDSVGGFLTHCGWNSVIEGLGLGRVLVLFPVVNDQGLNARLLSEKRVGVEIPRNERDGSFTRQSAAETVRSAMVDDSGESLRMRVKEKRSLFGDRDSNDRYLDEFIYFLREKEKRRSKD